MGAVDSMKRLQGWTDTTITHFHELAVTGERILSRSAGRLVRHREYRGPGKDLGALLQAGDPALHPCAIGRSREWIWQRTSSIPVMRPRDIFSLRCCSSAVDGPGFGDAVAPVVTVPTSSQRECRGPSSCPGLAAPNCRITDRKPSGGSDDARFHVRTLPGLSSCPPDAAPMGAAHDRPAGGARAGAGGRARSTRLAQLLRCNERCSHPRRFTFTGICSICSRVTISRSTSMRGPIRSPLGR